MAEAAKGVFDSVSEGVAARPQPLACRVHLIEDGPCPAYLNPLLFLLYFTLQVLHVGDWAYNVRD